MPGDTYSCRVDMTDITPALSSSGTGTILTIEVTAGSAKPCFPAGYNAWRSSVGCRVRSPAHEGRANREVLSLIAATLGIPKVRITIISGMTAPVKRVLVEGMTPDQVQECLRIP